MLGIFREAMVVLAATAVVTMVAVMVMMMEVMSVAGVVIIAYVAAVVVDANAEGQVGWLNGLDTYKVAI